MTRPLNLDDWPGKSPQFDGGLEHPAVYHMLDVAAVAERLIAPFGFDPALRDALVLLAALHDLGKISESFRGMLRNGVAQSFRHWELTEVLLFAFDDVLESHIGGHSWHRQALYAGSAGHHGRPSARELGGLAYPGQRPREFRRALECVGGGQEDASVALKAFCELWPKASVDGLSDERAVAVSWWLPGLLAAADWIGSNAQWFTPMLPELDLPEYLSQARHVADRAVTEAGLAGVSPSNGNLLDFALRPMQAACGEIPLPDGPTLAVIEDETGAGKTEAALLLAQRMLQARKGRGVFFALPTMATADAMFERTAKLVGRMFETSPTLTLAHGRAGLSVAFRDLVSARSESEDDVTCSDWLAESRRRALLADVGVGTVDQALLSVLPARFQTLRHFGLSSKILIVDEVHEMGEPYIGAELEALLAMHRAAGGSAILLTATLPLSLRKRLLATYGGQSDGHAYPALTVARGAAIDAIPKDPRPTKGVVQVDRLAASAEAIDLLVARAGQGAACVWVRNAVDDAIAAVNALRQRGIAAHLLHARFALGDRKRIEQEVLARAGKKSMNRAGYVLVGTQVLESSLDLDFDVMVSDLAPMAGLIQRAGRLWRHMELRPAASRPVPKPILHVLAPDQDKVDDARWLHDTLDRGAYVYPVAVQWRTAKVLFREGQIDAPSGLRSLIEAVHGDAAIPLPEVLEVEQIKTDGKAAADRGFAAQNLVNLAAGYRMGGRGDDDAKYPPTRLGDEPRILVLARREDGRLRPWFACEGTDAWAMSEVSARRARVDALPLPAQSAPEILEITRDWPDWKRDEVRLCPVAEDGSICEGLRYETSVGLIFGDKS